MSQFKAAHKFYEKNEFETISINKLPSSFVTYPIDGVFYKKENTNNHFKSFSNDNISNRK
jgi:hypothetical protein